MALSTLVIDDNQQKLDLIVELLRGLGIDEGSITTGHCIHDARASLRTTTYDLLVIDMALPETIGSSPKRDGGISLLSEMIRRNYKKPKFVVGVTGYEDIKREYESFFSNQLWYLLNGAPHQWADRFKNFINYIIEASTLSTSSTYKSDVFVVCALREPELQAITDLDMGWTPLSPLDHASFYSKGEFISGGEKFSICCGSPPKMGPAYTALYVQKVIQVLRPRIIAMTGVCAGTSKDTHFGDTILANPAWDWQSGKYDGLQAKFKIDPDFIATSDFLNERFMQLSERRDFFSALHGRWRGAKPANQPTLRMGPNASGSSVLANGEIVELIKEQHRKLMSIDMETYALYVSARNSSLPKPSFFSIKAVCDHGDHKKADDYQAYCSYVSANVLKEFLNMFYRDIRDYAGLN